jgi:DNA adenine methylase
VSLAVSTHPQLQAPALPFLKWVGGKRQLIPALSPHLRVAGKRYVEPFVGGGAVFFHLRSQGLLERDCVLADANAELINVYRCVQGRVEALIRRLRVHQKKHAAEYYYGMRAQSFTPDVEGAARTIYLNRTGFNGLYRVNSKGVFNVPMGRYTNPAICDERKLRLASAALDGVHIACQDFATTLGDCAAGTFLYLDPPYVPVSTTSSFTAYQKGGFGLPEQARLAQSCIEAFDRGAEFVLSNSSSSVVADLFARFPILQVVATRRINCSAEKRGAISEMVVLGLRDGDVRR